jgi:2-keto-4-pentenoate hydratase/2-oxohepta-3-ene-1,7-dioic acid hydratase in catechol pathway
MAVWARFQTKDGNTSFGTVANGQITEFSGDMFNNPTATGKTFAEADVKLLAPTQPTKILALWNNFKALGEKLGKAAPVHPLFLLKPVSSLAGPNDDIVRPKAYTGKIAYEGELCIVIGKKASNVSVEEAKDYIFGYTCINDVTAGELLNEDPNFAQWTRAKGYDTFSCIGPVIQTELDWASKNVVTMMGDQERQNYPLSDMIFNPYEQVSRISQDMTLNPGDCIAIGTSIGIGSIKDGAVTTVTIDGIGTLSNKLVG